MNKPRKAKSRKLPPLPLDTSETKCGICLDEVTKRGKIGPCSHLYCFPCLLEWSKVNNTCPQCKLTFRCISRIDFKTDTFEDKVFIKDTTLRSGHVSSEEEEYYHANSSDIEDSDPDFIDNTDIPDMLRDYDPTFIDHTHIPNTLPDPDSEPEAEFTQRKRKCSRKTRQQRGSKRKAAIMSDSDSDDNDKIHQDIISSCSKSPELFEKSSPPSTSSMNTGKMNCPFISSKSRTRKNPVVKSPLRAHASPNRTTSIYFTSPKYNKGARWASLDMKVKGLKRKRSLKMKKKPGITISTLSPGHSSSKWMSTRSRDKTGKENQTPTKSSVNSQFKVPFKKKKDSPKKLHDDPEDYFASILSDEEIN